jgi:glycosyltransferase involved in cell wall biosynthesis
LQSALAQCYKDYEIIVADDSGTAASREIVAKYQSERVKFLANAETLGIAGSVVRAVQHACGQYVAILNDDDVWEKEFLAELVPPLLDDGNRVMAFSDHWVVDGAGRIDPLLTEEWSSGAGRAALAQGVVPRPDELWILHGGFPVATSAVFLKSAVDWSLVDPKVTGAYDYWIAGLLAASRRPIFYVPKRLARYRVHATMETVRRAHDKGENLVYIFTTLRECGWFAEFDGVLRRKLSDALFTVGRDKLYFNHMSEARRCFWHSFLLTYRIGALLRALAATMPNVVRTRIIKYYRSHHCHERSNPLPVSGH